MPYEITCIVPCRNEEQFIAQCLDTLIAQDMPIGTMEILIVDGQSTDKTQLIIAEYSKKHLFIKMIPNPKKTTPVAFNLGIKHAQGEYIVLIGAHSTFNKEYVSRCLTYIKRDNVEHVGGVGSIVPRSQTYIGKGFCFVFTHPFGVGNSLMRTGISQPTESDTASTGCYHKSVFEKIGYFNENLTRSQDIELNRRLKKAGGRIYVYPDLVCTYYARSSLKEVIPYAIKNGKWALLPFIWTESPVSIRHLVPLYFTAYLILGPVACHFLPKLWFIYLGILALYFSMALAASIQICKLGHRWKYLAVLPFLFFTYHVCYGIGSLMGLARVVSSAEFYKRKLWARNS